MEKQLPKLEFEAPTASQKEHAKIQSLLADAGQGASKVDLTSKLMGIGFKRADAENAADKFIAARRGKRVRGSLLRLVVGGFFTLLGIAILCLAIFRHYNSPDAYSLKTAFGGAVSLLFGVGVLARYIDLGGWIRGDD